MYLYYYLFILLLLLSPWCPLPMVKGNWQKLQPMVNWWPHGSHYTTTYTAAAHTSIAGMCVCLYNRRTLAGIKSATQSLHFKCIPRALYIFVSIHTKRKHGAVGRKRMGDGWTSWDRAHIYKLRVSVPFNVQTMSSTIVLGARCLYILAIRLFLTAAVWLSLCRLFSYGACLRSGRV